MSKKLYMVLVVVLMLVLAACSRSASLSPVATATKSAQGTAITTSGNATEDPMALVKLFATQTAMASGGQLGIATPTSMVSLPGGTPIAILASPTTSSLYTTPGIPTTAAMVTPYPTTITPTSYTLQAGESPYCIARRFNLDPSELLTLNNLSENSLFQPGLVLQIPQTGNHFPVTRALHTHPTTYLVVANDTIYKIGCYFGDVDPLAIATVNHLVSPYTVTVGQSLIIP